MQVRAAILPDGGLLVAVVTSVDAGLQPETPQQDAWSLAVIIENGSDADWAQLFQAPLVSLCVWLLGTGAKDTIALAGKWT